MHSSTAILMGLHSHPAESPTILPLPWYLGLICQDSLPILKTLFWSPCEIVLVSLRGALEARNITIWKPLPSCRPAFEFWRWPNVCAFMGAHLHTPCLVASTTIHAFVLLLFYVHKLWKVFSLPHLDLKWRKSNVVDGELVLKLDW